MLCLFHINVIWGLPRNALFMSSISKHLFTAWMDWSSSKVMMLRPLRDISESWGALMRGLLATIKVHGTILPVRALQGLNAGMKLLLPGSSWAESSSADGKCFSSRGPNLFHGIRDIRKRYRQDQWPMLLLAQGASILGWTSWWLQAQIPRGALDYKKQIYHLGQ